MLNVCKQTFHISHVHISQKVKGVLKRNLQHIFFIWRVFFQIFISVPLMLFPEEDKYLVLLLILLWTVQPHPFYWYFWQKKVARFDILLSFDEPKSHYLLVFYIFLFSAELCLAACALLLNIWQISKKVCIYLVLSDKLNIAIQNNQENKSLICINVSIFSSLSIIISS